MNGGLEVLDRAIAHGQTAVVSVREGGTTRRVYVRFTPIDGEATQDGFWTNVLEDRDHILDDLIRTAATVEVSFNTDQASVFFDSVPIRRRRQWFGRQVLMRHPDQLTLVERRKDSREPIPDDIEVPAILVRGGEGGESYCEIGARVWDLSATGASFLCRADQPLPKLETGEPLAISLIYHGAEHRLNACHRYTQRLSSSSVRLGVQFNAQDSVDPSALARFRQLLEDLESLRIRRTFRGALRQTFSFRFD